jgi:hypothetical protein
VNRVWAAAATTTPSDQVEDKTGKETGKNNQECNVSVSTETETKDD